MENTRAVGRRRYEPAERVELLAEYRKGGLTQFAFARRAGISVSCLHAWLRKEKAPLAQVRLIELPPLSPARALYTLRFPCGTSLEVGSGFSPQELEQLCRVVRAL